MNRYYGNFHRSGGRRDSLTSFSNGPLSPVGPGKNQSGGTPLPSAEVCLLFTADSEEFSYRTVETLIPSPLIKRVFLQTLTEGQK